MNSFIIVSKDTTKRKEYITSFCREKNISPFDQTYITTEESSLGISDIRKMQQTLLLKPYKSMEKAVILENAHLLTIEAQNALLKALEEPPANTYIFLSTTTDSVLLPTITSRCKMVTLPDSVQYIEDKEALENDIKVLRVGSITSRLVLAEKLSLQKDSLSFWFEGVIRILREKLLANPHDAALAEEITILSEAYKITQTTNVNQRLALEYYFLDERERN